MLKEILYKTNSKMVFPKTNLRYNTCQAIENENQFYTTNKTLVANNPENEMCFGVRMC
jgi:hypothetical protein